MNKLTLAAGVAAMTVSGMAFADLEYIVDGAGVGIPDDLYDGSFGSMAFVSVDVAESLSITDVDIIVDIEHTWVGDLTMKLMAPSGAVADLVSRAGYAEPADDGSGCCGSSSDLIFGNEYLFDDAAMTSSEFMGDAGNPVPSGSWSSSGFGNTLGLTGLNGLDSAGTWTLYVGDGAGGDTGILDGFTLRIAGTPTPGALALLGLAGLAPRRRRR